MPSLRGVRPELPGHVTDVPEGPREVDAARGRGPTEGVPPRQDRAQVNLRGMELADLVRALAPLEPTPLAVRKLFARVHAHGAESVQELRATPQLPRAVRDAVLARAQLPSLTVVERRRADDGFVKYLF